MKIIENNFGLRNIGFGVDDPNINGEHDLLRNIIKPNQVIFDVGANVGTWSSEVLAINEDAQLYAFEPVFMIFQDLNNKVKAKNFYCFNIGFSDKVEHKIMYYYPDVPAMSSVYRRSALIEKDKQIKPIETVMQTQTIPYFCLNNNIKEIDLLKIDTEGSEYDVLYGSIDMLKEGKIKSIQFEYGECYKDSRTTLMQIWRLLMEYDYSLYRIIKQGLIHISFFESYLENYKYSNYFAVHNSIELKREK